MLLFSIYNILATRNGFRYSHDGLMDTDIDVVEDHGGLLKRKTQVMPVQ